MNPLLGVFYHWLGGVASGSFYVPFRGVKRWSWETSWIVAGVFSWIIAPWVFATLMVTDVTRVLAQTDGEVWLYAAGFGSLWGLGGLTFGLTMRYLGMSLGMAVALGYCTVFGTLIPPLFKGEFQAKLLGPASGRWVLAGLLVCVLGIIITALAGRAKGQCAGQDTAPKAVNEFDFKKGLIVATFSGIMSACFAFGLSAGEPVRGITLKVDMTNSALALGKTIPWAREPSPVEFRTLLPAIVEAGLFEGEPEPDLARFIDLIEQSGKDENLAAQSRAGIARGLLGPVSTPIAIRLRDYAARFDTLSDQQVIGIVDGLSSLSEKETALDIVDSGADLVSIFGKHGLWTGLPVLIIVLLGGFVTNFIWCVILNLKNGTGSQYLRRNPGPNSPLADRGIVSKTGYALDGRTDPTPVPLMRNYFFSALAGTIWYFQFFFYSMGETQMGDYKFTSWTLHMASIIIFSSIWGLALHEWKGASRGSKKLLFAGLALLVLSTVIIGVGNYVGTGGAGTH